MQIRTSSSNPKLDTEAKKKNLIKVAEIIDGNPTSINPFIGRALIFIIQNISEEELNYKDLAKALDRNISTINRMLVRFIGCSSSELMGAFQIVA